MRQRLWGLLLLLLLWLLKERIQGRVHNNLRRLYNFNLRRRGSFSMRSSKCAYRQRVARPAQVSAQLVCTAKARD